MKKNNSKAYLGAKLLERLEKDPLASADLFFSPTASQNGCKYRY